jgi:mannose-1-phosphate guanylyltransferase
VLDSRSNLWAIVLAGGEGTRLAPLTRALYGTELPKQFAVLSGTRSMLQATVDRALSLVPPERIVVVVARHHEGLAREQLREWTHINLLVQPCNLDTGPGLLLPLAWIRGRDRNARAVILPADHYVARPEALVTTIEQAEAASRLDDNMVALFGAEPDRADTEYGWIVPGRRLPRLGMRAVHRFFEKPGPELAEELLELGALWNTFIIVGSVETLWKMSERHMPDHAECLSRCLLLQDLDRAYAALPPCNYSRTVLERAENLALIPLRGAGWSDWGTPRRVFESLEGTRDHQKLLKRMRAPRAVHAMA